jgi:hypothetical protein
MNNGQLTQLSYTPSRRFQYEIRTYAKSFNTSDKLPEGAPVKFSADNVVSLCTADDMPIGLVIVRPNTFYGQSQPSPSRTTVALNLDKGTLTVRATSAIVVGDEVMIDGTDTTSEVQGAWEVKGKKATTGKIVLGIASNGAAIGEDCSIVLKGAYKKA